MRIGIIVGSTRPGRKALDVAQWVEGIAQGHGNTEPVILDLLDFALPLLDEQIPPAMQQYANEHTQRWAEAVAGVEGFVMVTPEYNHSTSGALKNALDYLFAEWNHKAVGFVGYGGVGGARAIEQLRPISGELKMADVRGAVMLSLFDDFEEGTRLAPRPLQVDAVNGMLDEITEWSKALSVLRSF